MKGPILESYQYLSKLESLNFNDEQRRKVMEKLNEIFLKYEESISKKSNPDAMEEDSSPELNLVK